MMKYCLFLFFIVLSAIPCSTADIIATTENGKKVLLRENGKWHYLGEDGSGISAAGTKQPANDDSAASAAGIKRLTLVELLKKDARYDFRKVRWGMNNKAVIASEDARIIKNRSDSLEYEIQFLGYDCSVVYLFAKDALYRAFFIIRQSHVDPALFYRDYKELKKYLTPLYGNALSDKCEWKNEIYRADTSKWGFAVSIGFLTCSSEWHSDRTRILLSISGGNHQILTNVEYSVLK